MQGFYSLGSKLAPSLSVNNLLHLLSNTESKSHFRISLRNTTGGREFRRFGDFTSWFAYVCLLGFNDYL